MSKNQTPPVPINSMCWSLIDMTRNKVISRELTMYSGFIARGYYFNWCLVSESERFVRKFEISCLRDTKDAVSFFSKIMETRRHYYDIVYKISSLTGTWPYLKPRARIFRVALLTVTMLTVVVPQVN